MPEPLPVGLASVAVRLADEGVPLRAIARATAIPSGELRTRLHEAKAAGALLEFPKEDWPPGFPRDQRALQLSRLVAADREAVTLTLQQAFRLTSTEVSLLLILLAHEAVPKERFNMPHRTIDVHICNIRHRLEPSGIAIATLWGYGYALAADAKRKLMDVVLPRRRPSGREDRNRRASP